MYFMHIEEAAETAAIHLDTCVVCNASTPAAPVYLLPIGPKAIYRYKLCDRCLEQFTSSIKQVRELFGDRLLDRLLGTMEGALDAPGARASGH